MDVHLGEWRKVSEHLPEVPDHAWQRLSCGAGSKGQRLDDWAFVSWPSPEDDDFERGSLVRRSIDEPIEVAHHFTHAPEGTPLQKLVQIAGEQRITMHAGPECHQPAAGEKGVVHGQEERKYRCRDQVEDCQSSGINRLSRGGEQTM